MAILKKGLFGPFTGKVGGVVGSTWNGIQVVKKLPARRKTGATPAQREQHVKFALLVNFLKPISPLLSKVFENSRLRMSGFNKAVSDNKNALTGTYPDFKIDYSNVMLGKNIIRNTSSVTVAASSEGRLSFVLNVDSLYSIKQFWTLLFIAVYEEESRLWIYKINPELSISQPFELDLSPFRSKAVHTYVGFMPTNGRYTNSIYTGMITVL